ncbi:MAG: hypothetical protein ACREOP_09105, partial [Thermodesulfobacteriota bacterium]
MSTTAYDPYYKAMQNLGAELKQKRSAAQSDKDLSEAGRAKVLGEIKSQYDAKIAEVQKMYHDLHAKDSGEYDKAINPPKPPSHRERVLLKARKAPAADGFYLDDDDRAAAVIESNEAVLRALEKSSYMNYALKLEAQDFQKAAVSAFSSSDMSRLEYLKEVADIRGDEQG